MFNIFTTLHLRIVSYNGVSLLTGLTVMSLGKFKGKAMGNAQNHGSFPSSDVGVVRQSHDPWAAKLSPYGKSYRYVIKIEVEVGMGFHRNRPPDCYIGRPIKSANFGT